MMNNTPLVTINCITYNHELFIRDALNGFLMQKTDFEFEILVHDDASTDNTANIIREYEAKYPDLIKPIYQTENQYSKGNNPNRVYQFPRAKGKYIAMCEGDDYWTDPLKLQKQIDLLEKDPKIALVFHDSYQLYPNKPIETKDTFCKSLRKERFFTRDFIKREWFVPTASMVFRKSCLPVSFPEWINKVYSGDVALQLLLCENGYARYIPEVMSVYRRYSENSLSSKMGKKTKWIDMYIKMLINFKKYSHQDLSCAIYQRILVLYAKKWYARILNVKFKL